MNCLFQAGSDAVSVIELDDLAASTRSYVRELRVAEKRLVSVQVKVP